MTALYLRHRDSSGTDPWNRWEAFESGSVLLAIKVAPTAPGLTFSVELASKCPRIGAFQISRVDEERWRIMPARYTYVNSQWSTRAAMFHVGVPMVPIILSHCPEGVAAALAKL